jgi:hypothetical protein
VGGELFQAFEVVHVGFEDRHLHHRGGVDRVAEIGQVVMLTLGGDVEVGQRLRERGQWGRIQLIEAFEPRIAGACD